MSKYYLKNNFCIQKKKRSKKFLRASFILGNCCYQKSLTFSLSVAEGDENLYRPICLKQMMSLCIPTYRSRINLMQTEHTCLGWTSCLYLPKEVMIIKSTTDLLRRKLNGTNFDQVLTRIHGNEMRGSFVNRKFLVL